MSTSSPTPVLAILLELARRARHAASKAELGFMAVNDSHQLAPYRQSALWLKDKGVFALSGVVQIEANAPYAQWLERICTAWQNETSPREVTTQDLSEADADEWAEWLPAYGLWMPFPAPAGGILLARDIPWEQADIALLSEWLDIWRHAWLAMDKKPGMDWRSVVASFSKSWQLREATPWWKQKRHLALAALLAVLFFPVRLSVLAPGELVPSDPAVIRAPLDGVVASFAVRPNEMVKANQLLFSFDPSTLAGRLEVARQQLATAEAEYRQSAQLAVSDPKYKSQLALLTGKIEERRAEAEYVASLLERSSVAAPRDGIALFDDPSEWVGKPVVTGERIMRIAKPGDMEVEAWVGVGDAIPLRTGASLSLYLNATPLHPVDATVRYMAHEAVQRPDGSYAYRVRASLDGKYEHRVGLKGTAKLRGSWVPMCYWMLRRPVAAIRQYVGW